MSGRIQRSLPALSRRELLIGTGATLAGLGLERRARGDDVKPAKKLRFYALGDTGAATETRDHALAALAARAERDPADFVLLLGDNFYDVGLQSADDPRWKSDFEDAFGARSLEVPFHVVLGNHDHFGKIEAQVEYTQKSSRWRMPSRYHAFTVGATGAGEPARAAFFLLDTTPIVQAEDHDLEQLAWLETELAACTAPWKIVAGHHPVRTGGGHRADPLPFELGPLFEASGVDLFCAGHDHDLQLVGGTAPWLQLVSGATSKPRPTGTTDGTRFASSDPGFALVELDDEEMTIEFVTAPGDTRHVERVARRAPAAAPTAPGGR
jgi:acid phosphatase